MRLRTLHCSPRSTTCLRSEGRNDRIVLCDRQASFEKADAPSFHRGQVRACRLGGGPSQSLEPVAGHA